MYLLESLLEHFNNNPVLYGTLLFPLLIVYIGAYFIKSKKEINADRKSKVISLGNNNIIQGDINNNSRNQTILNSISANNLDELPNVDENFFHTYSTNKLLRTIKELYEESLKFIKKRNVLNLSPHIIDVTNYYDIQNLCLRFIEVYKNIKHEKNYSETLNEFHEIGVIFTKINNDLFDNYHNLKDHLAWDKIETNQFSDFTYYSSHMTHLEKISKVLLKRNKNERLHLPL